MPFGMDWAGMSALMVCAPGESKVWSLDTMLPVVLGSLAGLLIAVQQAAGGDDEVRRAGAGMGDTRHSEPPGF